MATIIHGMKQAFEDRGAGRPAFVFVHGWACNSSFFAPQVEHFSRRHRTVSVDLRGHGKSDAPNGPYTIAAFADDTAQIIRQLGLGKVVCVGHSSGAWTVMQLAATYPTLAAAIVMVDPAPFVMPAERQASAKAMRANLEFDGRAVAAQCKVPALHLAATQFGSRHPRNPPHLMSEWLPHVVNGWTVGAGHFSQLEVPDQVNAMIEAFLRHYA